MSDVKMLGDYGCYIDESNVISFQVGDNPRIGMEDPDFSVEDYNSFLIYNGRRLTVIKCVVVDTIT